MTEPAYAAEPVLTFGGSSLREAWAEQLVAATVESATNLPSTAYLRFRDQKHELLKAARITPGTEVTVSVAAAHRRTQVRIFHGEVTALETTLDSEGRFTVVRATDRGHRLMRGSRVAAYVGKTVEEITSEVAARHRLSTGTMEAEKTPIAHQSQPGLTDWELLAHLAEQRGLHLAVEDRELTMRRLPPAAQAPSPSAGADRSPFVLQYGVNLLALRASVSSTGQVKEVEVRGWDPSTKAPVVAKASAGDSSRFQLGTTPGRLASAFGASPELLVSGRPYTTSQQVDAAARAVAEETASSMAELEATVSGTPFLRAGLPVTISGIGEPFAGRYTITACRQTFDFDGEHGYVTQLRVGPPAPPVVSDPPPLRGPGVAVGIVTDTREPGQGQRGAVRLQLPWLSQRYVTDWVRTVQWGGAGGGGVLAPEVGDEVLVGFEHGRLDRPYVLGGLYNGKDAPTDHGLPLIDATTGRANRWSVSSRDGDRLELLSAAQGPQGVRLKSGDGRLTAHLNRKDTLLSLDAGDPGKEVSVVLDGRKGTITVDAGPSGTVVLKAGTVRIEGTGEHSSITLKATTVTVESDKKLTLKGGSTEITGNPVDIN